MGVALAGNLCPSKVCTGVGEGGADSRAAEANVGDVGSGDDGDLTFRANLRRSVHEKTRRVNTSLDRRQFGPDVVPSTVELVASEEAVVELGTHLAAEGECEDMVDVVRVTSPPVWALSKWDSN